PVPVSRTVPRVDERPRASLGARSGFSECTGARSCEHARQCGLEVARGATRACACSGDSEPGNEGAGEKAITSETSVSRRSEQPGFLLLEDGTLFHGVVTLSTPTTVAEVVFTTNMSGYQEVFTDPSYDGQIVVMTAPMIGNYGVNDADPESGRPQVAGVVMRE